MDITLLYFDDCPNWKVADERLAVIAAQRADLTVTRHLVDTLEEAKRVKFHGSPSILVDGVDVFAEPDAGVGLSCRIYRTPDGPAGAPTVEQLKAALDGGRGPRDDPQHDLIVIGAGMAGASAANKCASQGCKVRSPTLCRTAALRAARLPDI